MLFWRCVSPLTARAFHHRISAMIVLMTLSLYIPAAVVFGSPQPSSDDVSTSLTLRVIVISNVRVLLCRPRLEA